MVILMFLHFVLYWVTPYFFEMYFKISNIYFI